MLAVIIGDYHTMHSYRYISIVTEYLNSINAIDMLLQENAFNYNLYSDRLIKEKIMKKDYMISDMYYEIGLECNLRILGIDLNPSDCRYKLNIAESFMHREKNMLNVSNMAANNHPCLITLGDTHLRSKYTEELGTSSPVYRNFANKKDCFIVRADEREIDVGHELPSDVYTYNDFYELIRSCDFIERYRRDNKELLLK